MARPVISEAFSAGLGFALGLAMAQCIIQAFRLPEKPARQVIICLKCGGENSLENRFCWHCGEALYPPSPINCPRCSLPMPLGIKFCRRCGSPLGRLVKN
ncbi:MAG: zinc ribbon domain-containing protein [Candidatus Bathyarchaeia archaeon]